MILQLLNIHKIKFVILEKIFEDVKLSETVNVHIDLHSVLADLYKSTNYGETNWIDTEHGIAISSAIINMAAHYRLFFYSKYRINTRIFFYFCRSKPKNNASYYSEYGNRFFNKYAECNEEFAPVNTEVSNNLKLTKIITDYIPDVYYMECKNIEPLVAASYMVNRYCDTNIVLTRDIYWYQAVNLSPITYVLHSKRDDSYLITKKNIYDYLLKDNQFKSKYVTSELLSVIYSFSGVKSRDVRGLKQYGVVKIIKILDMAINRGLIKSSYTHIKNVLDEIYSGDESPLLIDSFKAIDLQYQLNELSVGQKTSLDDCIVNKYNKKDLLNLNVTHYTDDYTLMIDELFKCMNTSDNLIW